MARNGPTRANPFVVPQVVDVHDPSDAVPHDELFGGPLEMTGPPVPPGTQTSIPHIVPRERFDDQHLPADQEVVFVVGLHGGAGATTVSRLLGQRYWPAPTRVVPIRDEPSSVLFVARSSGVGIAHALQAGQEWGAEHWPDVTRVGLVLVADGPRTPAALRSPAKRAARLFPRAWRLSWIPGWHLEAVPSMERIPLSAKIATRQVENYFFDKKS